MTERTLLFILLLITSVGLAAQQTAPKTQDSIDYSALEVMDYDNVREYIIADVSISGIEYIQKEVLLSLSGLKVGNTIKLPGDDNNRPSEEILESGPVFRCPDYSHTDPQ